MKPIQIEFVEDQRWIGVWALAFVSCLTMVSLIVWRATQLNTALAQEKARVVALNSQLQQRSAPVQIKTNPRQLSAEQAARLLEQDLNKGFAAAENLQDPGARLRALALENISGVLRLEYDLDSMVKATTVTEVLNSGYEDRPWRLDAISGAVAGASVGSGATMPMVPVTPVFRGMWSVQMKSL